ncbi:hypothetical protein PQE34_001737, partial [Klebsiella aerogenes]
MAVFFVPDIGSGLILLSVCKLLLEKSVYLVSLQSILRSRLIVLQYVFRGAGSAQRAASRRRPLYSRALAAKIATSWFLRLIPEGFG